MDGAKTLAPDRRIPKGLPHAGEWTDAPNPKKFTLQGLDADDAIRQVGDAYGWEDADDEGGDGTQEFLDSVREQHLAQITARTWQGSTQQPSDVADSLFNGDHVSGSDYAAMLWVQYQSPDDYGDINASLRTPAKEPLVSLFNGQVEQSSSQIKKDAVEAFAEGGWTTTRPMTLYRALTSDKDHNWSKILTPGTTFEDDGMVSTTAHPVFAQGWLGGYGNKRRPASAAQDVVMKIKVPEGTRILGGDPQFIETMLKPGSKFKVVSAEQQSQNGVSPLDHDPVTGSYTLVTVELQQ